MIKYYKSYVDNYGYNHSIDMVKVLYDSVSGTVESILEDFRAIKEKGIIPTSAYWEKINNAPCSKWNYFLHHIHLDSIYVKIGKYVLKDVGNKQEYKPMPCISIEVNPNKHYDTPIFITVMDIIKKYAYGGILKQVDYAIDVPCQINDVVVLRTQKERGLYKGTQYFGARGRNGFVKIYNKAVESNLDQPLTRIETTYQLKEKFSSIDFGVAIRKNIDTEKELSLSTGLLLDMLQELQVLGSSNIDSYMQRMNYRTRKQILEAMNDEIVEYRYNAEYLNKLIDDINVLFGIQDKIQIDDEGFLVCDDFDLPW